MGPLMKRIQASRLAGRAGRRRRPLATPTADTGRARRAPVPRAPEKGNLLDRRRAEVATLFAELWAETLARGGSPETEAPAEAPVAEAAPEASPPPAEAPPTAPAAPARPPSLFIDHAVRSGQSIAFPEGDVTIMGTVASGAEIVAGGSIHVYGALRGRALAGIGGNAEARIICHSLEAELLVINGLYRVADEIEPALRNRPAQVRLDGAVMTVTALDRG